MLSHGAQGNPVTFITLVQMRGAVASAKEKVKEEKDTHPKGRRLSILLCTRYDRKKSNTAAGVFDKPTEDKGHLYLSI